MFSPSISASSSCTCSKRSEKVFVFYIYSLDACPPPCPPWGSNTESTSYRSHEINRETRTYITMLIVKQFAPFDSLTSTLPTLSIHITTTPLNYSCRARNEVNKRLFLKKKKYNTSCSWRSRETTRRTALPYPHQQGGRQEKARRHTFLRWTFRASKRLGEKNMSLTITTIETTPLHGDNQHNKVRRKRLACLTLPRGGNPGGGPAPTGSEAAAGDAVAAADAKPGGFAACILKWDRRYRK